MTCTTLTVAGGAKLDLAQVLREGIAPHTQQHAMPQHHWRTLRALMACRTPALGAHVYRCASCQRDHFVPHSCRNRHCPTCQPARGAEWMDKQCELLLPIPYFHVVFTLPHQLNALIQQNQPALYGLLFDCASATLMEFGRTKFQANIGVTAVLHTWSQTLMDHYHLHCIVTGGGMSTDGLRWVGAPPHWLFAVRALSKVFRAKFCEGLRHLFDAAKLVFHGRLAHLAQAGHFAGLIHASCQHQWVVYAKRPFNGPQTVMAYLARYTHRVGLTNARLLSMDTSRQTVCFSYKDYARGSQRKAMTLDIQEFVRRFRLHILPERFTKIRHYGLLANRGRQQRLAQARALFPKAAAATPASATSPAAQPVCCPPPTCPHCKGTTLKLLRIILPSGSSKPPLNDSS
jgi:hypothetical protein